MFRILFSLFVGFTLCIIRFDSQEQAQEIAKHAKYWVPGVQTRFRTEYDLKAVLSPTNHPIKSLRHRVPDFNGPLPESYDARTTGCVHRIRDQGSCGSCWAFGATESLSDRFCVFSNHSVDVTLSPQWLVNCNSADQGCGGGSPEHAMYYAELFGIASDTCLPYKGVDGACPAKCADGSPAKLYYLKDAYTVGPNVDEIRADLLQNGPIEACFMVMSDFNYYKSGIYHHTEGSRPMGGHCVKLVGWGVQNGVPYWTLANSWGADWGEQGFFRILRGVDECGIESELAAGIPQLGDPHPPLPPTRRPTAPPTYTRSASLLQQIILPKQMINITSQTVHYVDATVKKTRDDTCGSGPTECTIELVDHSRGREYDVTQYFGRATCTVTENREPFPTTLVPDAAVFNGYAIISSSFAASYLHTYSGMEGSHRDLYYVPLSFADARVEFPVAPLVGSRLDLTNPNGVHIVHDESTQWYSPYVPPEVLDPEKLGCAGDKKE